jgi:hypothetical protein
MRFSLDNIFESKYSVGDNITKNKFLWIPKYAYHRNRWGGEWRWLERAEYIEQVEEATGMSSLYSYWKTYWITE